MSTLGTLFFAITIEVAATTALPRTDGFRHLGWTPAVLVGYAASFWLLAIVVRSMPVSTAYALWSGVGTATVALVGITIYRERADWLTILGIALVVGGVVALNLRGAH